MKRLYNWVCATLVVTACSPSALTTDELPTGAEGLTPLTLSATLDEKGTLARANGTAFEDTDGLVAYLRHVTWDGGSGAITEAANNTLPDYTSAKLVAFTPGTLTAGAYPLTAATPLYWDDFSNSTTVETDLRTAGHYLQAYYGYAVNSRTDAATAYGQLTSALGENTATGTLTWTVPTDQTDSQTQQECDLLWAKAQTPVQYAHATTRAGLTLPYTHALCRLTVALVAADGFSTGAFTNATVTTAGLNKTATFSAPTAAITGAGQGSEDAGVIQLRGEAETTTMIDEQTLPARSFSGLFVPHTLLTAGSVLATIADVDGNHYTLPLTSDILTAWTTGLADNQTQAAYHYKLTVTLRKQKVAVSATLADWSDVSAEAQGSIQFTADVPAIALSDQTALESFRLYRSSEETLTEGGLQPTATTCTFAPDAGEPTQGSWTNDPAIYWANASTRYHFRALAEQGAGGKYTARADEDLTATQGQDLLWGTSGPDAIPPRTGTVPLTFGHLLSKLTVQLTTAADTPDTEAAKRVDLDGALLTLSPLATTGTVRLTDGGLTLDAAQENAIEKFAAQTHPVTDRTTLDNYIVLPQPLGDDVTLRLTLADGTTYRVQLNTCTATVDETQQAVTAWKRGRHYTYTLHVEKETVRLAASVQDWVKVAGSGNANLDWD